MNLFHSRNFQLQMAGVALFLPSLAIANDGMGAALEPIVTGAFLVAGTAAVITFVRLERAKPHLSGVQTLAVAALAFVLVLLVLWLFIFLLFNSYN